MDVVGKRNIVTATATAGSGSELFVGFRYLRTACYPLALLVARVLCLYPCRNRRARFDTFRWAEYRQSSPSTCHPRFAYYPNEAIRSS